MRSGDELFDVIAELHEGVADDSRWLAGLDGLSDALGGAALFLGSTQRNGSSFELSGHRVDPTWIALVNGPLASHDANPVFALASSALRQDPSGTVMKPMPMSRIIDPKLFRESRIYVEAIKPAGHEYVMTMVLAADPMSARSLTAARPLKSGDFGEEDCRTTRLIGPHLLSVLKARQQHALARSQALMMDCMDQGVILLSEAGRVLHCNSEATRIIQQADGLSVHETQLRGPRQRDTDSLRFIVNETKRAARAASLVPQFTLRLGRPSGRSELVVRAFPAGAGAGSDFGVGEVPTVALFVFDLERPRPQAEKSLGEALGLTDAEAAVAARIWEGESVGEAAASLSLSRNTVKTHLKVIFAKTGVTKQSALVRRIAALVAAVSPASQSFTDRPSSA